MALAWTFLFLGTCCFYISCLDGYEEVSNEGDADEGEAMMLLHLFPVDGGEEVLHMRAADGEESHIGELLLDIGPLTSIFSIIRWTIGCS